MTTMIANVSPGSQCCEHTLNTLRYADRVKELKKEKNLQSAPQSKEDSLARMLMLPRQNSNAYRVPAASKLQGVHDLVQRQLSAGGPSQAPMFGQGASHQAPVFLQGAAKGAPGGLVRPQTGIAQGRTPLAQMEGGKRSPEGFSSELEGYHQQQQQPVPQHAFQY